MTQVKSRHRVRIGILILLVLSLLWGLLVVLPSQSGSYALPEVERLGTLRQIRKTGLLLPEQPNARAQAIDIGGHRWVIQELDTVPELPAVLLVRPQADTEDKPYVDWSDLDGFFQWQRDPSQQLTVEVAEGNTVQARWFIARDPGENRVVLFQQTVAVVQWYAFDQDGRASPWQWFWRDQRAQLRRDRVPWIAVCIRVPIEPGTELETTREPLTQMILAVQGAISEALQARSN